MSRKWTLLPLILFIGSTGTLQAQSLDSPGTVYINGQPCSRACQAYMNWSYQAQSARRHDARAAAVPSDPEFEQVSPVARPRAPKHATPVARTPPPAAKAASNVYARTVKAGSKKIAAAEQEPERKLQGSTPPAPGQTVAVPPPLPAARPVPQEMASKPPEPEGKIEAKAEAGIEKTPEVAPPAAALDVAAAPAAPAVAPAKATQMANAVSSSSLDDPDNLVALVLAGPGINSLSDLNNRNIAIAEKQSASSGRVSAALMAAGAAEVKFSEAKASAIERLMNGEVPAAVVLAPRDVANLFPEIEGFRTFRVPLKAKM